MPPPTTIHHHPPPVKTYPPPPTTSQNLSTTTTHHQPKYVHHHLPPPTTNQNTSTNTYHFPKMDHHSAKAKIYSCRHCFKFLFLPNAVFLSLTEVLRDKVLISSFFKIQISITFSIFYDI